MSRIINSSTKTFHADDQVSSPMMWVNDFVFKYTNEVGFAEDFDILLSNKIQITIKVFDDTDGFYCPYCHAMFKEECVCDPDDAEEDVTLNKYTL
jgi:hypothetical protein